MPFPTPEMTPINKILSVFSFTSDIHIQGNELTS